MPRSLSETETCLHDSSQVRFHCFGTFASSPFISLFSSFPFKTHFSFQCYSHHPYIIFFFFLLYCHYNILMSFNKIYFNYDYLKCKKTCLIILLILLHLDHLVIKHWTYYSFNASRLFLYLTQHSLSQVEPNCNSQGSILWAQ